MSDNGRDSCPYAQNGCTYKNENCRVLMAHEDECPYNLKINDQENIFDVFDTIVKPRNPIKQDAPTTDRSDLPFIKNQNAYLPNQQPQNTTAFPVQQASIQTRAAASTNQQHLNQQLSYPLSQPYVQELPIQTSATIPTNQQPQIQQYSYPMASSTVYQGQIKTKSAALTYQQHLNQQHSYPTQYSNMQQPPIQTYAAISTYQQHSHAGAYPTMQQVPVQTTQTIPTYQQNQIQQHSYPLGYPHFQQVQNQNSVSMPTFQQSQIQHSQFPNFQQSQKLANAPIPTNQHSLIQKNSNNLNQIPNYSQYYAIPTQQAPGSPIFDLQQPGQPIFDMEYQTPNRLQVLPIQQQMQNQVPSPFAQEQQVQRLCTNNDPNYQQIDSLRSSLSKEFETVSKQQKTIFNYQKDYIEGALLGKGSFGQVYECTRNSDGQKLAVKKIFIVAKEAYKIKTEAQKEYQTMRAHQHPNLLKTLGYEEDQECCYIFMEFASKTLHAFIQAAKYNNTLLKQNQVLHIAIQVLQGLKHLHSKNVLHRDVKPLNCLLMNGLNLKLSDFGGARQLSNDQSFGISLQGTRQYAAPEILTGQPHYKSVDVWSFGVMLYELCTMNLPFPGLKDTLNADFKYLPVNKQEYCQELIDLIKDCLTYDPSARPTVDKILERPFLFAFSEQFDKQNEDLILTQLNLLKQNAFHFPERINSYNNFIDKILAEKIDQNPQVNVQVLTGSFQQNVIKVEAEKFRDQLRLKQTFDIIQKAVNYTIHNQVENQTIKIEAEVKRGNTKSIQLTEPQEQIQITQTNLPELIVPAQVKELNKPEKTKDSPVKTAKVQTKFDQKPEAIIQVQASAEVQKVKAQDLAQERQEKVKSNIKNQEDLVGQSVNFDANDLEIGQLNFMQNPVAMVWEISQQIKSTPQTFKDQQKWRMPPEQIILQEPQKPKTEKEIKVDQVKPENQEQIQYPQVNILNVDTVNENKALKIDKETQDLIDKLQKENEAEMVEEKITLWKCPFCFRLMALNEKCDGCNRSIDHFNIEVQFEEVTKQAFEAARKNVEAVKIKEEETETMWLCPICKVYMKLDEAACMKCDKEIQHFENIKFIPLEKMLVQVKLSELNNILKKQNKVEAKKLRSETYWMCPRGCSDKRIKFNATCRICYENFLYFSMDKRIITNEDLFGSDDEPSELWSCQKCKKHNIDAKKNCSKCHRNKYYNYKEDKGESMKKLQTWHWKCFICKFTNKSLKIDQCQGCKINTRKSSVSFEVEYECKPKVKVESPKQIELAKSIQDQIQNNPKPAEVAKSVEQLDSLQWKCSCGQLNIVLEGFNICIQCKRQKPQQQEQKQEDWPKYPENTWMCKFCRELNYSEEWVKISTAYCQTCKKFSEERSKEILIALSKQYKERECEKCKQNVFIKFDQNTCNDCLQTDDGEVLASADEEVSEMRKVSSDKKKRNETKICSICFGNLNGSEKDGFCFICTKKPLNAKDKYQQNNYPQNKPKEESIIGKLYNSLFQKDEKKPQVEPSEQLNKADLFCRDCKKVVKFTRIKSENKKWIDKEGHVQQTTFF